MNHTESLNSLLKRFQQRSFIIGVVALALCGAGAFLSPQQFYRSYLFGYLFWMGIALGSFAIVALHHLVGGGWGFVIQRLLESGTRTLPVMALLFVPLFFGMKDLYAWARPEVVASDPLLQHKSLYLNIQFFWIRAAVYFALWLGFAYFINKWSHEQDRTSDPALTDRIRKISGAVLVVFVLTVTFAAIDWVMSLEPHWFSTIYGLIYVVGQGLLTLAFVTIVVKLLSDREPLAEVISPQHFHDLGNLMLAFVMLWAYIAFSQFLIIWAGNLPEEITWYLHRLRGGWQWLALALVLFHFALPFVLLLLRTTKRKAEALVKVAMMMIFMRFVDLFWLVNPSFSPEKITIHWMDILAPMGIGGIWLAVFAWQLQGRALLPLHDPRLQEAFQHE